MYKKYMLKCEVRNQYTNPEWNNREFCFDTEEEMIEWVQNRMKENSVRVESAFKLEKLNNNIFTINQ